MSVGEECMRQRSRELFDAVELFVEPAHAKEHRVTGFPNRSDGSSDR